MPKPRATDAKLERLKALRDEKASPAVAAELQKFLRDASNHVVAAAATLAARFRFRELASEMVAAFDGFMIDAAETDKTCAAKTAIVDALNELDFQEPETFLAGIRHIQLEPVWGGTKDTAAGLRSGCAMAVVRIGHPQANVLLADLLADRERVVRIAAAQALAASGSNAALLLLRLKARLGDGDAEVTGECLTGLMRQEPKEYAPFVAEFLESEDDEIVEAALLALGNSRRAEAFEVLKSFWDRHPRSALRETILVAMALLRFSAATDFLLALLADSPESTARQALAALATLSYDDGVRQSVSTVVQSRKSKELKDLFDEKFPRYP
jgi:HEAT repeat protein